MARLVAYAIKIPTQQIYVIVVQGTEQCLSGTVLKINGFASQFRYGWPPYRSTARGVGASYTSPAPQPV